jgi:hypothetical protein
MNAFCKIRHGHYVVDLGYISISRAKELANTEAKETKRTMILWFYNEQLRKWESLSVHHPSSQTISLLTNKKIES